ncbi:hypothetical protein SUGI_0243730 [Cryptomeria japonica]|nr:hypothetical protein SUGI_0243730 [Cryptomeria japonica]
MEYEQQRQGSIAAIQLYQEQRKRSIAASKLIAKKLYESLESEEKQMFMHIACFFNAKSRDMALKIWKASQWRTAEHAAQTLLDKCLVQVEHYEEEWRGKGESVFRMHDHLRDLGRQMADEALPRRLWRPEHLRSMRKKGFKKILEETNDRCYDKFVDSSLNSRIEYLIGNSNNCAGSGTSSTALLWLGVDQARWERISSWISLTQLHYFGARGLQEMNSLQIMSFTRVRFSKLVISGEMCPSLKHPEIAITNEVIEVELKLVKTLEILLLDSCSNLKTISDLSSLTNLQELIIRGYDKLESIEGVQELRELKSLVIIQAFPHSGVLNFISELNKLPSHYTVITAETADEAVSRLNLRLFSDVIGGHAIAGHVREWSRLSSQVGGDFCLIKCNRCLRHPYIGRSRLFS